MWVSHLTNYRSNGKFDYSIIILLEWHVVINDVFDLSLANSIPTCWDIDVAPSFRNSRFCMLGARSRLKQKNIKFELLCIKIAILLQSFQNIEVTKNSYVLSSRSKRNLCWKALIRRDVRR